MVTEAPASPEVGDSELMAGAPKTVNVTPLLGTPPTATVTGPVLAVAGTGTTMLVELQLLGVAAMPLKLTVLLPCVVPKFSPEMVTDVPDAAEEGVILAILAGGSTVKFTALLAGPPVKLLAKTTSGPVVAPAGTRTLMLELNQKSQSATTVPLKVTAPV